MLFKKKAPTLEETIEVINLYVNSQIENRNKMKVEYESKRSAALNELKSTIADLKNKDTLHAQKAAATQNELNELIHQVTKKADELVLCEEAEHAEKIEVELGELNTKRMILEAKLKAFTNAKVGLSKAGERKVFKKLLDAYDGITYTGPSELDLNGELEPLKKALESAIEPIESAARISLFRPRDRSNTGITQILNDDMLNLIATSKNLTLLKKRDDKERVFNAWLRDNRDIKFDAFISTFLKEERLRKEEWQREEDERKIREKRERDEHHDKVMAEINRKMTRGI